MPAKPPELLENRKLAILLLVLAGVGVGVATATAGGRDPSPDRTRPLPQPRKTPVITEQTEPHTCGWHTLSSIYTTHRLNPNRLQLRERLGVDAPALPGISGSTGTVQPDMVRVLSQDGFLTTSLAPKSAATREAL